MEQPILGYRVSTEDEWERNIKLIKMRSETIQENINRLFMEIEKELMEMRKQTKILTTLTFATLILSITAMSVVIALLTGV